MENRRLLHTMRAKYKLNALCGFREIKHVDIPEIPKQRQLFPRSETDYWWEIDLGFEESSACVYELGPKQTFLPHLHNKWKEMLIPLNKDLEIEVITDKYFKTVKHGELVVFDINEPHAVINLKDEVARFIVLWSPKMKGWTAQFMRQNQG